MFDGFLIPPAAAPGDYAPLGDHDPALLALSLGVGMALTLVGMHMALSAPRADEGRNRQSLIALGAMALGGGLWAMHWIGLLAIELPGQSGFNPWPVALSLLPSLAGAWCALQVLAQQRPRPLALVGAGGALGLGLVLTHAMTAYASSLAPLLHADSQRLALAGLWAWLAPCAALWLRAGPLRRAALSRSRVNAIGAVVLGAALVSVQALIISALRVEDRLEAFIGAPAALPPIPLAWVVALVALLLGVIALGAGAALRTRQLLAQSLMSNQRQQALMETAIDGVVIIDARGMVQSFNHAAELMLGYSAAEILGRSVSRLMPEPYRSGHDQYVKDHGQTPLGGIIGQGREWHAQRKDGSLVAVRLAMGRIQTQGAPMFVGFLTDLTERNHLQAQREHESRKLIALLSNLPGVAFRCKNEKPWTMEFVSEAVEPLTGYSADDFVQGRVHMRSLIFNQDAHDIRLDVEHAIAHGLPYHIEYRIKTRDGHTRWLSQSGQGVRDAEDVVRWIDGVILDITDAKLRSAEHIGTVAAINRSQAAAEFDLQGHLLYANAHFLQLMGYDIDEVLGQPYSFFCHPKFANSPEYQAILARLQAGEYLAGEGKRLGKGGRTVWMYATYSPIFDVDGKVVKIIKLAHDLTQRREMEQHLREAKEAAEAAAAARASFLANMSHEIRTPMNAIIGFTDALLDTPPLTERQRRHLRTVQHSAKSLLRLLNDILDIAKLDKGAVELEIAPFDLQQLCRQTLATLEAQARQKSLALKLDWAADLPEHWQGDAFRLQQVLLNLLHNALKFTHQGHITLQASGEAGALRLKVCDSGIGMDADALARLFTPFSQADVSTTRRYGGTGLGTSIAHQLITLMGGHIQVQSQIGQGSCFTIDLPLPLAIAPIAALEEGPEHGSTPPSDKAMAPLRILGVDDVATNLELLDIVARRAGHRLARASSGAQALARLRAERFDVVLMDLHMPDMDGLQACVQWRVQEHSEGRTPMPIIALSASVLEEDRQSAYAAGMNGFATKPIDAAALWAEVLRVVGPSWAQPFPAQPFPAQTPETVPPAPPEGRVQNDKDWIDWDRADALWGSRRASQEALRSAWADNQEAAQTLQTLRGEGDYPALATLAHRLRGMAAHLALVQLHPVLTALEAASKAADAAAVDQALQEIQTSWAVFQKIADKASEQTPIAPPQPPQPTPEQPIWNAHHRALVCQAIAQAQQDLRGGALPEAALSTLGQWLAPAQLEPLEAALERFDFDAAEQLLHTLEEGWR